jgi:hypothetical protein
MHRRPASVGGLRPPYVDDRRRRPGIPVLALAAAGVAGLLLLLIVVVPGLVHLAQRTTPGASTAQTRSPSPAVSARPATQSPQQTASGVVTGIQLTPQGACSPGSTCTIEADVHFQPTQQQTVVAWTYKVTDVCHGNSTTTLRGSSVPAQPGWVHVISDSSVSLPSTGQVRVVAETSSPADVTSDPLTIGGGC